MGIISYYYLPNSTKLKLCNKKINLCKYDIFWLLYIRSFRYSINADEILVINITAIFVYTKV